MNKMLAIAIGILVAGQAVSFAQEKVREEVRFIDEDGDGINDVLKDHDGDGIPNPQDPDWKGPQDGEGRMGSQVGRVERASFGKGAFRGGRPGWAGLGTGTGISEAAGPKGRMIRWGRG